MRNEEKWPTIFEIKRVSKSLIGDTLNLYFVTCVGTRPQVESLGDAIEIDHELQISDNQHVATGLYTQQKIEHLLEYFEPRSREWRGQYQPLAKAVCEACRKVLSEEI